jgi:hypothetical protein
MTAAEIDGGQRCRSPLKSTERKQAGACRDASQLPHCSRLTPSARYDAAPELTK